MSRIVLGNEWDRKPRVRSVEELTKDAHHTYALLRQFQADNNDLHDKLRRQRTDYDEVRSKLLAAQDTLRTWKKISITILVAVIGVIAKEAFQLFVKLASQ